MNSVKLIWSLAGFLFTKPWVPVCLLPLTEFHFLIHSVCIKAHSLAKVYRLSESKSWLDSLFLKNYLTFPPLCASDISLNWHSNITQCEFILCMSFSYNNGTLCTPGMCREPSILTLTPFQVQTHYYWIRLWVYSHVSISIFFLNLRLYFSSPVFCPLSD